MEGVFDHGRKTAVCGSPASRPGHGVTLQRVWDFRKTGYKIFDRYLGNKKINFSQVFAGQAVGIKEAHYNIWLVSFMDYDLGYFDVETRCSEPLENPFGPKVLPMS